MKKDEVDVAEGRGWRQWASRKLVWDAWWALAGNISSVLTGFVSIKVITALVSTDAYGQVSLVQGIVTLLTSLLAGPLITAHGRVYFDYVQRGLEPWYWRFMLWVLAASGAGMCLLYLVFALASAGGGDDVYLALLIPAAITLAVQPGYSALSTYFECKRWQRRLALTNVLYRMLNLAAVVVLLFLLPAAAAIILGQGVAGLLLMAWWLFSRREGGLSPPVDREPEAGEAGLLLRTLGRLSWMLALGWVVQWVLTTSDRYLVNHYMTAADVGLYAMNYTLWATPYIILNGWLETLTRGILYDRAAKNDLAQVRRVILHRAALGVVLSAVGTLLLCWCGPFIGQLMLGEKYWGGTQIMIVLAAGHCFFVLAYSLAALFLALKRTGVLLLAAGTGAIVNVLLNLALIPRNGLVGAAWGTLLAYVVWALALAVPAAAFLWPSGTGENHPAPRQEQSSGEAAYQGV
jgi:O-antigen/teichoic acid export membrane protein